MLKLSMAVNVLLRQAQVLSRVGTSASLLSNCVPKRTITRSVTLLKEVKEGEEDMEDLQKNPYYNKYADKIAKLQK